MSIFDPMFLYKMKHRQRQNGIDLGPVLEKFRDDIIAGREKPDMPISISVGTPAGKS